MAIPARPARGRKPIRRGPGERIVEGKSFRLADEVRYIQRRAADHNGRIVTIGQLVLFSTETGDAWPARPRQSARRRAGSRRGEQADARRGNRYQVRDRLEGPVSDRRTSLRVLGSRY